MSRKGLQNAAIRWLVFGLALALNSLWLEGADNPARVAIAPRSRGSQTQARTRSSSIRVDVNAIQVPVTAMDERDQPVANLKKEDFHLFEDGVMQEIVAVSNIDVPVSVGIIFDSSSSMSHKLDASLGAVDQFLRTSVPGDEFLLIRFSDQPHFISGFTSDTEDLSAWLHSTRPQGLTALNDAIYLGIQKMKAARNNRKVLLVLSDGSDNNSSYSKRQLEQLVREADVQIYSISFFEGSRLLDAISGETGGRLFRVQHLAELPDTIEKLSRAIRSRYVLTYYSSNLQNDGKYRKISVALANPALRVSWRRGYYAPAE